MPETIAPASRTASSASRAAATARSARGTSRRPASVSTSPRLVRTNSATPSPCSSRRNCSDRLGWETKHASAAPETEPRSTAARK